MEVILAGYNVDADILEELKYTSSIKQDITPETIAAAYARISRSAKRVDELRLAARAEVEAARRSNKNIVFTMGHSSIAEHAVFNIDIIGVSRLLIEDIQHFRLCSFTEKSQRYVSLAGDFVTPSEIKGSPLEIAFIETIAEQNDFYLDAVRLLNTLKKHPDNATAQSTSSSGEGWAKEDARYALSLATQSQMGMTINARNLELMLRRLRALPLQEAVEFAAKLEETTKLIAPSLVRYTSATEYERSTRQALQSALSAIATAAPPLGGTREVRLVSADAAADNELLAAVLFSSSRGSFAECRAAALKMNGTQRKKAFTAVFAKMERFDAPLREFENIHLAFELVVSASCFAQLKRHRMVSSYCQPYDIALGVKVPPAIIQAGLSQRFLKVMKKSEALYSRLFAENQNIAPYILTNAHRRRVLFSLNARELYHISRLRMDEHAQWDIRKIVTTMVKQARRVMPLTMMMAAGKDAFAACKS